MIDPNVELIGRFVRLEPLTENHVEKLVAASAGDSELYRWSPVPLTQEIAKRYVADAIKGRRDGTVVPFATVRLSDGMVIGSTRFFDIAYWPWPSGHDRHGLETPDVCEIGYTWLSPSAIRTEANTEAKLLMLTLAFESWMVLRVCFHTDARNERSRAALARIGAKPEGILRAHRIASDLIPRDSARFSIVADEWSAVKASLEARLR